MSRRKSAELWYDTELEPAKRCVATHALRPDRIGYGATFEEAFADLKAECIDTGDITESWERIFGSETAATRETATFWRSNFLLRADE